MCKPHWLIIASLAISACSIVDVREEVHYSYQSGRIAQPMLGKVVPGVTTRQWLLENFGEPNTEEKIGESSEQITYHFDEHLNLRTRILFLFNYRSTKVVPRELQISLTDDIVTRIGPSYFEEDDEL